MASIHSLTTAPINVYSKTFWTSYIAAINEEAAYELGMHEKINPAAVEQSTKRGWSASLFTPNVLNHTDVYVDHSTNLDFSSRTVHHHHHTEPSSSRPLSEEERRAKKKQEEEDSLHKYKWLGPIIGSIGAFLTAYTWRGYQRAMATHGYTEQVQRDMQLNLNLDLTPAIPLLNRVVILKLAVDTIRYKIIYRYFLACAGILVGGGLFTLGAFAKQPRLIPWGGMALAVSAIWAAASAGFHWQDKADIRALYTSIASMPERAGDAALAQLFYYYTEGMTLIPQYVQAPHSFNVPPVGPGGYQPFFSGQPDYQVPPPSFNPTYVSAIYAPPSAPYMYENELGSR